MSLIYELFSVQVELEEEQCISGPGIPGWSRI